MFCLPQEFLISAVFISQNCPFLHMIKGFFLLEMCQAIKTISASLAVSVTFTCEKQEMTAEHSILQRIMIGLACLYFGIAQRLLSGFRVAVCKVQYKMHVCKLALLMLQSQRITCPTVQKHLCLRADCKKWSSYSWFWSFLSDVPRDGKVICSAKVPCHMLIWLLCNNNKLVIHTSTSGLSWVCYLWWCRCWYGLTAER